MTATRYDGKPFLRLLDAYVLSVIGRLEPEHEQAIVAMEPKLREIYQSAGTWSQIVGAQMGLAEDFPGVVDDAWQRTMARAAEQGGEPDPVKFTHAFVDTQLCP